MRRRGLQGGTEAFPFGQKRPTGRGVAAEALNGSANLQRARVQIHIGPLQAERFAEPKPAAERNGHERFERMLRQSSRAGP